MPSILLVDDDPKVLAPTRRKLRKAGYVVVALTNPAEALRRLSADVKGFSILVTDWAMHPMSGIDLIRKVRVLEGGADLPIILHTSADSEEIKKYLPASLLKSLNVLRVHKYVDQEALVNAVGKILKT